MTESSKEARKRGRDRDEEITAPQPKRRRRWPWVLLLGLLVVIFFLPMIVTKTSLKQTALDWALADFQGKVTADEVSVGWFSPAQLSGLKAVDPQGNTILAVEKVVTTKSLIGFLNAGNDFGYIEVHSPVINLQLRENGSNLEDALAEYLKPTDEPATPLPHVQLSVTQGQVNLSSTTDQQTWQIDELNLNSEISGELAAVVADLSAAIHTADRPSGSLNLKVQLDAESDTILADNGHAELNAASVPASLFVPFAQRLIGPCNAIGDINGIAQVDFQSGGADVAANIESLTVKQFALVAPQFLKDDQLSLNELNASGQVRLSPAGITATKFQTTTDVGQVTTDGQFDISQLTNITSGQIPATDFTAHGEVDVAKLANMLPQTIGLHQDLQVQSGMVTFDATTRKDAGTRRLLLDLTAKNLTANRGGELLNWHKPLRITARVGQTNDQMILENVKCESDFLTVEGSANSQVGNFIASGDLAQLRENLSQFVDLTGIDLAGEMTGEFGWSFRKDPNAADFQVNDRPVQIGGKFELLQPVIQMPDLPRWTAPKLSVVCNAAGQNTSDGTIQIRSGGARAIVDQEVFTARLAEPIPDLMKVESLALNCDLKGRLDGWLAHVRNFIWVGDFDATGRIAAESPAIVSWDKIQLTNLTYNIANMRFDGYGANFAEPEVSGQGKLSYNLNNGLTYFPALSLTSSSLSARASKIQLTFTDVIDWKGNVAFRADVHRLADWYALQPDADSVNWFGTAEGSIELASDENSLGGQMTAVINDLVAAQRSTVAAPVAGNGVPAQTVGHQTGWSELIREKQVTVNSQLGMAQDFDSISFSGLDLVASALQLSGKGSISDLAKTWQTNIQGEWNPDWQQINGLLDAYTYQTVKLAGNGRQPLEVVGPLFAEVDSQYASAWFPPQLQVRTQFAWDQGQILHLPLGASDVGIDLNQSVAFLKTGEIPFVGGTVQASPVIDFRGEEPVLVMEASQLVNNINLSSDVCRDFLKYVTPLVADATEAQGKLTVQHDAVRVPLYDPMQLQARGVLQLSEGTIGAGPLAKQLFSTVTQIKQLLKPGSTTNDQKTVWMDLGNQDIPFAIQNGRVHHKGIRLNIDDVTIETEGFVGLDQTLSMTANIPIQAEWLGDSRWLQGLQGQSLQIPISGTVTNPRLDTRAVQQLSRQLVQQAAGSAINGVVEEKAGELQNRFNNEVNEAREKLNNKLQDQLQEKIGGELQKGLEGIFNRKK